MRIVLTMCLALAGCDGLQRPSQNGDEAGDPSVALDGGGDGRGAGACPPGQRIDPATDQCEECLHRDPNPFDWCPCSWDFVASPFPYCDGPESDYECYSCTEGPHECQAIDLDDTVWDCFQLEQCCNELASTSGAVPCCAPGETVVCERGEPYSCVEI